MAEKRGDWRIDPETGESIFKPVTRPTTVANSFTSQRLTPEQIAEINAQRAPRNQINPMAVCGARNTNPNSKYATCHKPAGWQTRHPGIGLCKTHGGNTPAGNINAARTRGRQIIAERKAAMAIADPDHPDVTRFGGDRYVTNATAEEALLEEVRRSVAMVRYLEERIGEWDPTSLPELVAETSRGAATTTDQAAWLLLYREERAHMVRTAKLAIDAGIAERMVRIAEDQGRLLAGAIRAVLAALNLTPDQARMVPQVVPGILRSLSAAQPLPSDNASAEPLPALLQPAPAPNNQGS